MSAFEELGISPEIIQAIEEDDWLLPTPVQQDAIPLILGGGDVLVAAETGSGKTGAFGLPCLQVVHETLRGKAIASTKGKKGNLHCELNLNDKDMFVLVTEDGNECKSADSMKWNGIRATIEVSAGKYMYEVLIVEGLCRVGWGAPFAKLELGTEDKSFGYGSTGKKSWNKKFEDYGEVYEAGDVIGCLLDREKKTISFRKNGRDLGEAFSIPVDFERIGLKPQLSGKGFHVECRFESMEFPVEGYEPIGKIDPTHTAQATDVKGKRFTMCMILEPTRDLAEQTYKNMVKFNKFLANPTVRIALFVGGIDEKDQFRALEEGVDICVGTLQKTMDYVRRGKLDVSQIKFLVLDEADDLQKKDDRNEIPRLNAQIKRGRADRVQTLFFSATLHTPEIQTMIAEITTRPIWVDLKGKDAVPDTVHHVILRVDPKWKLPWQGKELAIHAKNPGQKPILDGVHDRPTMSATDRNRPELLKDSEAIKNLKPQLIVKIADAFQMTQCLIFCRTNVDCDNLEKYLNSLGGSQGYGGKMETGKENPYSCVVLAGMRNMDERRANLESFKEADVRFLVCTDVAARGLDIAGLPYLIMMTLPDDAENYIHRVGRVGRAERVGLAISLVGTEKEKVWYHKCPSKGKSCQPSPGNTKLTIPFGKDNKLMAKDPTNLIVDEGGCTIWYNEPDLIEKVEKRIGMELKEMDIEDFCIPGVLPSPFGDKAKKKTGVVAEPVSRRQKAAKTQEAIVYGKKANDVSIAATSKHCKELAPAILELCALEKTIQQLYCSTLWSGVNLAKQERPKTSTIPAAVKPTTSEYSPPPRVASTTSNQAPAMQQVKRQEPAPDKQPAPPVEESDDKKQKTATGWAGKKKGKRW
eukprot:GEMP01004251.1.p1 GENE.GEMP01004251.1~~GEMP01004251.1.p1  ORF type:complete len:866 (+),score=200.41 GEMP01004251.1:690-3287(+)